MTQFYIVLEYICEVVLQSIINSTFLSLTLSPKKTLMRTYLIILSMNFTMHTCAFIIGNFLPPSTLNFFLPIYLFANIIYSVFLFSDKTITKLLAIALQGVTVFTVEVLINLTANFIFDHIPLRMEGSIERVFLQLIAAFFLAIFTEGAILLWRKTRKKIIPSNISSFILFPVSQILLMIACMYASISAIGYIALPAAIFLVAGAVVSVIADVIMFRILLQTAVNIKTKEEISEIEYQSKIQYIYYEYVTKKTNEMMKYKHDFNNALQTAYNLMEQGGSAKAGREILDSLNTKNSELEIPYYCYSPLVNAVLFDKENKAKTLGIKIVTEFKMKNMLYMNKLDACKIFVNLLDNAIHATSASQAQNPVITLKMWQEIEMVFVKVTNPVKKGMTLDEIKQSETDKSENEHHGY